jgi:hypothetical protein
MENKIIDLMRQVQKRNMPSEDKEKWPKQAAGYLYRPETKYHCDECVFSKEKSTKCALFGSSENISPIGGCNLFIHKSPESELAKSLPYFGLVTKLEAGYTENKEGFTCGRCEYFSSKIQSCKRVRNDFDGDTPGIIDQHACCNRWDKDKERGEMTDKQLEKLFENK